MHADDGEDVRMLLRELDRAAAAFDGGPDRDDARHASFGRAPEDVVEVRREIRVVEVGVSLDQHCRLKIVDFRLGAESICNLQSEFDNGYHSITVLAQVRPPPKTTIRT
jgi:hypothetical protein